MYQGQGIPSKKAPPKRKFPPTRPIMPFCYLFELDIVIDGSEEDKEKSIMTKIVSPTFATLLRQNISLDFAKAYFFIFLCGRGGV